MKCSPPRSPLNRLQLFNHRIRSSRDRPAGSYRLAWAAPRLTACQNESCLDGSWNLADVFPSALRAAMCKRELEGCITRGRRHHSGGVSWLGEFSFENANVALARWLGVLEHHPVHQKRCRFNSHSGYLRRLWAQCQVRACWEAAN